MDRDRVVRVSYRRNPGFLERLGSSFAGSLAGFGVFLLSFYVLYWNESRSVETASMLDEAQKIVVPIHGRSDEILATNNQLIHISGPLQTQILGDPKYPVAAPCVKLSRKVEMYQWVEHSEVKEFNEGDQTRTESVYSYDTEWSFTLHQSRHFAEEFGHQNPKEFLIQELHQVSNQVSVHGLELSASAIANINWLIDLTRLPDPSEGSDAKLHGKYYYHAVDPSSPQVGDVRVSFQCGGIGGKTKIGPEDEVAIIAKNSAGRLVPYHFRGNKKVELLHRGVKSADEMLSAEQQANSTLTWFVRFGGWLMMFVGLSLMTKIVTSLVSWIPIVGSIVSASVTMFNITTSLSLSLITIAVGWFRARPLLSVTVAAVSVIPWYLSRLRANAVHSYYSR